MRREEILAWLRAPDPGPLLAEADRVRREVVGEDVHLRGLFELGNHCRRACTYCGIRAGRRDLSRYRMSADELLDGARLAACLGYGTVVLQAGEDLGLARDWMSERIREIKGETDLAVTLSLGERPEDLRAWREAGADRYLLRIETTEPALHRRIHPPLPGADPELRFRVLERIRALGFEVGSGVMVGIPGQSWASLADDLLWFAAQDLDMVGLGPWMPDPSTPLASEPGLPPGEQVPADADTTLRVLALTRLLCPEANIPSTTALATLGGRADGLRAGANVVMPNLTPPRYRALYRIYPNKAGSDLDLVEMDALVREQLEGMGRPVGRGRGDRVVARSR